MQKYANRKVGMNKCRQLIYQWRACTVYVDKCGALYIDLYQMPINIVLILWYWYTFKSLLYIGGWVFFATYYLA